MFVNCSYKREVSPQGVWPALLEEGRTSATSTLQMWWQGTTTYVF